MVLADVVFVGVSFRFVHDSAPNSQLLLSFCNIVISHLSGAIFLASFPLVLCRMLSKRARAPLMGHTQVQFFVDTNKWPWYVSMLFGMEHVSFVDITIDVNSVGTNSLCQIYLVGTHHSAVMLLAKCSQLHK